MLFIEFFRSKMLVSFFCVRFLVDRPSDLMVVQQIAVSLKEFDFLKGFIWGGDRSGGGNRIRGGGDLFVEKVL